MEELIKTYLVESSDLARSMAGHTAKINAVVDAMVERLKSGNKLLVCGNGGSAAQSSHMVGELMCRFEKTRKTVPCISLSSDMAYTTAWVNDFNFETLFERGVEGYGKKGDVLIAITTSGNSKNVIKALRKARDHGLVTVALLGGDGGSVGKQNLADYPILVPHGNTAHIQEGHLFIIHIFCKLIEKRLFPDG